jgi:tetratricopeptide (TPR) repeat protein
MTEPTGLAGREVAFTGRLASLSRDEAVSAVEDAGGRCVATPRPGTDLLVVGRGGPPLGEDGHLTRSLQVARDLQRNGHALEVVSEEEWLTRLGLDDRRAELSRLYTTAQLARILDVPAGAIRAWMRQGLVTPARTSNRLHWFDWAQVAAARTLVQLARDGVKPARIRKSLDRLAAWLGDEDPALSQLEVLEQGGPVLVRLPDGRLAEPGGQLRLGFDAPAPAEPPAAMPLSRPAEDATPETSELDDAEADFVLGVEYEGRGLFAHAQAAYERALSRGGPRADVLFNLGNALYALGHKRSAQQRFEQAVELEADYVEAWNNLANVMSERGQLEQAVMAYHRALALAPDYADAHYNLAETLAASGDVAGARRHWQAYLQQDPTSSWADHVRERLARFEG